MKVKDGESKSRIFESVADVAAIFGSSVRLKILYVLAQAPRSVDTLAELTGMSFANTSQHLQRLLHEGMVSAKKDKLSKIYRLQDESIALLIEGLFDLTEKLAPVQVDAHVTLLSVLWEIQNHTAIMLDIRDDYEANQSPVVGALCIPLNILREKAQALVKKKTYYIFCRGRACESAMEAVSILRSMGFEAFWLKESPAAIRNTMNPQEDRYDRA